ncbi:MAG: NYN domain-containing protein [Clostridia bacterium]|nr:NYN domain-containing protein [Clostridia bacterium]MBR0159239.1 NYN domain-containing protein [Clostridia bacterium]MBR7062701.1 NYN domain-containing protein [Clostridia bacterium]
MGLFGKKKGKTVVFVDFDHWCAAMDNVFKRQPAIDAFQEWQKSQNAPKKVYYFGNFMNPLLEKEKEAIEAEGAEIVDTRDPYNYRSDRTDFVMLDYIYRCLIEEKDVDTFILFTADNRFVSVLSYLRQAGKKVILCGVRGCLGAKLKAEADEVHEVPEEEAERNRYYDMIIDNFRYIYRHKERGIYPTFLSTVTTVARLNEVPEDDIRQALQELIDKKIVFKAEVSMNQGENTVRVLRLDKGRAIEAGLYVTD